MGNAAASESTLTSLEFPVILDLLSERTRTPYGGELARQIRPSTLPGAARSGQTLTRHMVEYHRSRGPLPLAISPDARPLLKRLEIDGVVLGGAEILVLLDQAQINQEVRGLLTGCEQSELRSIGRRLPDLGNLLRYLDGKIAPSGELQDRCSPELQAIRRRIASLDARLEEALREISARPEVSRVLQEDFVALRNNRHVLPVRIDGQGAVEGIVHALSSSGATVYIEPLSTVHLNNDLVRLKEEEEVEVRRILLDFADLLKSRLPDLRLLVDALGDLDVLGAKAALAEDLRAVEPELMNEDLHPDTCPGLQLRGARHPLLERSLAESGRPLVPLDLTLEPPHQVLVISGPNTGGKTVALKTVGLMALMAQSGLHLPVLSARLPVFQKVLIDIGDHQSIPDSLSTFSARLANISAMARDLETPALVLLDEAGTGTDPEEGGSLGTAIIDFFRQHGALVLATTHHQTIKAYASTTERVANASMEFDESSLQPRYRLRGGIPGRSGGLDIAERLGLPEPIIRDARRRLPRQREMMEAYLSSLRSLKERLEQQNYAMEGEARQARQQREERAEADRRLALDREVRFSQTLEEIAADFRRRWNEYLGRIADADEQRRRRRSFEREERKLRAEAFQSLPAELPVGNRNREGTSPSHLEIGDRVRVASLRTEGVVERLDGDRVVIRAGSKRLTAARSDLEPPLPAAGEGRLVLPAGVHLARTEAEPARPELHLIGKRVAEALDVLDKYLDEVYLAGISPVRVIHGMGTGRLRTAIRQFLASHPHVEGFSEAEEREGGGGATVVRIRL